jgi:hypothetical protein
VSGPSSLVPQTTAAAGAESAKRTRLTAQRASPGLEQDDISNDAMEHLNGGWPRMYWEPLRRYLES